MKVLPTYNDGLKQFEPGDRVRLTRVSDRDSWIAQVGQVGTVLEYEDHLLAASQSTLLHVQTDRMREEGWGFLTVPPWFVELEAPPPIPACDDLNGPSG